MSHDPTDDLRRDALELAEQGEFAAAARQLRRVTARDPDDSTAHALLAHCLVATDDLAAATDAARRAVALAPEAAFSHGALAAALVARQRFDEALPSVETALRLDPEDADHYALLARVEAARGRWAEALRAASRGLASDPDHVSCGHVRVLALRQLGRAEDADRAIRAQLSVDPSNAVAHAGRGWSLLRAGARDEALAAFREALALDPDLAWAREGALAALKARHGVYGAMLRYFMWMDERDRRTRVLVLLGGVIGYNLLRGVVRQTPALAPVVYPILALYVVFLFSSWLADPLFNLVAMLSREARPFLSRDARRGGALVGVTLLAALAAVAAAFLGAHDNFFLSGLALAFVAIPVAGVYECESGWPRRTAAALAALWAAAALGAVVEPVLMLVSVLGAALGSWVTRALAGVVPKK